MGGWEAEKKEKITVLECYRRVFLLENFSARWFRQYGYTRGIKNLWSYRENPATRDELLRHLDPQGRFWLGWTGWRRPGQLPETEYLVFDVDAKTPEARERAADTVVRIATVFGEPWFVGATPSYGFHVYHQFDRRTELARLMTGEETGVVADRLRAAGLLVGKHHGLEIYPQPNRCLRGPLGTDQPLVDPGTLMPLGIGSVAEALAYVERRMSR